MTKDFGLVKCPNCGYEYTVPEVFFVEDIFGKPTNIIRDDAGEIILVEGETPRNTEQFTCDKCGCVFTAKVNHQVTTKTYLFPRDEDEVVIDLKDTDKEELF